MFYHSICKIKEFICINILRYIKTTSGIPKQIIVVHISASPPSISGTPEGASSNPDARDNVGMTRLMAIIAGAVYGNARICRLFLITMGFLYLSYIGIYVC